MVFFTAGRTEMGEREGRIGRWRWEMREGRKRYVWDDRGRKGSM